MSSADEPADIEIGEDLTFAFDTRKNRNARKRGWVTEPLDTTKTPDNAATQRSSAKSPRRAT